MLSSPRRRRDRRNPAPGDPGGQGRGRTADLVAVVDERGAVVKNRNVTNGVETILKVIGECPTHTPVAFEAAFGWGWLAELLDDYGYEPHLVHPTRCKTIATARLKNDKVDAETFAQLPRADLLPGNVEARRRGGQSVMEIAGVPRPRLASSRADAFAGPSNTYRVSLGIRRSADV
jgi:transposase